ncbi:DDE superfamily endonuclease containing protein [Histomonas meleagridis]|uniref:DDE superfamily endonuclease containing protein n=1 Tax=Histomonas meleagridis TaxID=135588 RepID=UPI00355A3924|nr:DDE superfamily endonuclease containing protein [Histomonas meleagridis]KAH0799424.1 DDE superfamily endonuclease containing protein [Histomonas meleagridis]
MKRNNFSLRKPHVSRRGQLKVEEVDHFLKTLSDAIEQYGSDNVFNMDDTSVRIAYYPDKIIGVVGSDSVHVDTNLNSKENFTAIMTCTRNKLYPPIIYAKGKTEKCTKKFKLKENNIIEHYVWRSDYGWTDEDVMKRYLYSLHEIHPCVLVLDSFRAHITGNVLQLLGIWESLLSKFQQMEQENINPSIGEYLGS